MQTDVQITFRDMEPSDAIAARIRERVAKLEQFHRRITSCRVIVEAAKRRQKATEYQVHIDLTLPGQELVVSRDHAEKKPADDMYVAIRNSFDALERRLKAIEVHVMQRQAAAAVLRGDDEGRAGDQLGVDVEPTGEPPDETGLPGSELALEPEQRARLGRSTEPLGERLGLERRGRLEVLCQHEPQGLDGRLERRKREGKLVQEIVGEHAHLALPEGHAIAGERSPVSR